jgi:hypothetical protein
MKNPSRNFEKKLKAQLTKLFVVNRRQAITATGKLLSVSFAHIWTVESGKITKLIDFFDTARCPFRVSSLITYRSPFRRGPDYMHRLALLIFAFLVLAAPLMAQEKSWEIFDSSVPEPALVKSDSQEIYETVLKIIDRWNQHDIEGSLAPYWKSPDLLVVINLDQYNGWQQLHDFYIKNYSDPNSMGKLAPARLSVKLVKPDVALALIWSEVTFPDSKKKLDQNTLLLLRKFEDGWKITAEHTNNEYQ